MSGQPPSPSAVSHDRTIALKALVTGGSRGIGLACALQLARDGYDVVVAARGSESLKQAVNAAAELGLKLRSLSMDVSDPLSVSAGFAQIGRLDVLVHSAGIGAYSDLMDPDDPANWQRVLAVNLTGAYLCARAARSQMPGPGRMIFVSSVLGLRGMRHSHAYCASKHGVIGMVRALAQDLIGDGITVNAVCPGWVNTEMAHHDLAAMAARYDLSLTELEAAELAAIPLGRWIEPQEVAALAAYLSSSAAAALTGQALELSGGL